MEDVTLTLPRVGTRIDWHRRARELSERVLPAVGSALRSVGWSLASVAIALGTWQLVCLTISRDFPTPLASLRVSLELLQHAFTKVDGTPGIGLQVLASMKRIAVGLSPSSVISMMWP